MAALAALSSAGLLHAASRLDRYAVVLHSPPLAARVSSLRELRSASTAGIAGEQQTLRSAISACGVRVTGSAHMLVNAIFVHADAEQAARLRALPGVARVERMLPLKPALNKALDLVSVSAAWNSAGGQQNAGDGVKIGILDSGIDLTHPAFDDGGFSMPAGFPKCSGADCAWTNNKVIAARSYVSILVDAAEPQFSRPDDTSPRDRMGHGTAVAMAAAGRTATGPVATITGVAPKAWLGNYKIFGSPGVNDFTFSDAVIAALEDAVADGMDIVSLSLGAPALFGPQDAGSACGNANGVPCDVRADAVQSATQLGLTVVVAAGDDGDLGGNLPTLGSIQTPGTAPAAITVGATTNSHILPQTLRVTGAGVPSSLAAVNALFGNGPKPDKPITAPLRDVSKLGDNGLACSALPGGSLSGAFALIQRGNCNRDVKVINAQNAGAIGVVLYQYQGTDSIFAQGGLEQTGIPAVLVGYTDGTALKTFLASNPDRPVTLDPAYVELDSSRYVDEVAYYSSEGPAIGAGGIKPELVAPGDNIYIATQSYDPNGALYSPSGFATASGTSFAAPLVAGAVALAKQANRGFTPGQLKSAVVNTASATGLTDFDSSGAPFAARVSGVGAGKLNAGAAVKTNVTVEPATLSFGAFSAQTISLRVTNTSSAQTTLRLSLQPADSRLTLSGGSLTVNSGQAATVTVRLSGTAPSPGSYEGALVIDGGAVQVRVPYQYLVGDGVPYNIFAIEGSDFLGSTGEAVPGGYLGFKLLDKYGVPVPNVLFKFRVVAGGGRIDKAFGVACSGNQLCTDTYGIGEASAFLGGTPGDQEFAVDAGNLTLAFSGRARQKPAIRGGGVVNAASGQVGQGVAPGAYISVFGSNLSEATRGFTTNYLPVSLATTSVSFDVPGKNQSYPGKLSFVSPGQVNVLVPWELQGLGTVQMKVSLGDFSTALINVPLNDYSPAFFEYFEGSQPLIAAQDQNFALIGGANPARRGQAVTLYANGLGPVSNQPASGELSPSANLAQAKLFPTLTIGGSRAQVLFAGLTPGSIGLYQINALVPPDAPAGLQPVVMTQNGITSKTATLPVQ